MAVKLIDVMILIFSGQELVDQWYAEEAKFDYTKPEDKAG